MSSLVEIMTFPYIMENKTCVKPPTSIDVGGCEN